MEFMLHYLFKMQFMELIGGETNKYTSCLSFDPTLVNTEMEGIQSELMQNPKKSAYEQMKQQHKAEN
jgi:hypothetical protein